MSTGSAFGRPVLLTMHSRKHTLEQVLEAVRKVRPTKVYLASDGPRRNHPGEDERVNSVREYAVASIDWDCEVKTRFLEENNGCRDALSGAISWFFDQEDAGIILEDDCVPGPDFFRYCDQLLTKYSDDDRVMHIGGSCLTSLGELDASYYFSRYPIIWGWASWSRAWEHFSLDRPDPDQLVELTERFSTPGEQKYWKFLLNRYYDGHIDTWDYAWATSIWLRKALSISPTRNLVSNVGFGQGSTHTKSWKDYRGLGNRPIDPLGPIVHPTDPEINDTLDQKIFKDAYERPIAPVKAMKLLRHVLASIRT